MYTVLGSVVYEADEKLEFERIIIKNDTLFYKKYVVISTIYDESGKLISCKKIADGNITPSETAYVFAAHDQRARLLVWESFLSMKPITKLQNGE